MTRNARLMEMLTGYAAAHQHPFNIAVHMIGIPTIMLGAFIALSWVEINIDDVTLNLAHVTTLCLFVFYFTLDRIFSLVFIAYAIPITYFATVIGNAPFAVSATVAGVTFFGGYLAQFVGHAVEKSVPVVLRHPIQANLAAPFFTVVELFKILGLREALFDEVQKRIAEARREQAA